MADGLEMFKFHKATSFKIGKVFKILWSEPMGGVVEGSHTSNDGTRVYSSIRRFAILEKHVGHCVAIPIITFHGNGTKTQGVARNNFAIIWSPMGKGDKDPPKELPGELPLQKRPIRMNPINSRERLHPASRINFAKVYTIECNVRVCFIGTIHQDSIYAFRRYYDLHHPVFSTKQESIAEEAEEINQDLTEDIEAATDDYGGETARAWGGSTIADDSEDYLEDKEWNDSVSLAGSEKLISLDTWFVIRSIKTKDLAERVSSKDGNRAEKWTESSTAYDNSMQLSSAKNPAGPSYTYRSQDFSNGLFEGLDIQDFVPEMEVMIQWPGLDLRPSDFIRLNRLAKELASVPPNKIWISSEDNSGVLNQLKGLVEGRTGYAWHWWPLESYRCPVTSGYERVFWYCGCGEVRWEDVPLSFARPFRARILLKQTIDSLTRFTPPTALSPASTSQKPSSGPGGQLRNPDPNVPHSDPNRSENNSLEMPVLNPGAPAEVATRTASESRTSLKTAKHVLLGVSRDRIRLAQIMVENIDQATPRNFFKELRTQYSTLRGPLREWFGIFRYAHCHFVKFEKFGDDEIAFREKDSIPKADDPTYQYEPQPMDFMPPITEHEFRRHFYACHDRCSTSKALLLGSFHRCAKVCREAGALDRIPKRTSKLDEHAETREIFWGIYAKEDISFLMVCTYHFLILAPGVVFWLLWAFYWDRANDLQNGSVPFFASLGCLTLFWFPLLNQNNLLK